MTDELRAQLLEAHVQHELALYRGEALDARMRGWTRSLFVWLGEVKLDDVMTGAQIVGIIERYAIDLRVSGGIMELAGEMAQIVLDSPASAETRLGEVLVDAEYERFAESIARLEGVWRELIARIAHSETADLVHAQLVARLFGDLWRERSHGLFGQLLERLEARAAGLLGRYMAAHRDSIGKKRERHMLQVVDPELVRSVADELWTELSTRTLAQLFQLVRKQDIEDFVVLGHDFWLEYRRSPYFMRITRELVGHFFAKYGPQSVAAWIEDMGVTEAMVANELHEQLGPVIRQAVRTGGIEHQLRLQLRAFYDSPAARALLG